MKLRVSTFLFLLVAGIGFFYAAPKISHAQTQQGGIGQVPLVTIQNGNFAQTIAIKDSNCDGRDDLLGLNLLGNPITKVVWKLLCPVKVDANCDGYADLTGIKLDQNLYTLQCGNVPPNTRTDLNCDGFDDTHPGIDVRRTPYWSQMCPDQTKYTDANCDGLDDKLKGVNGQPLNLMQSQYINSWRLLCPAKVDANCDGYADISGIPLLSSKPLAQMSLEEAINSKVDGAQCPGGIFAAKDADCNGSDDRPLGYSPAIAAGASTTGLPTCLDIAKQGYVPSQNVPQPICLDITNTQPWKNACLGKYPLGYTDANCDGIEDNLGFNLLQQGFAIQWRQMCPAQVDLNCDGYADDTGSKYGTTLDKNGNLLSLVDEPHYKYQCPNGHSVQNRDLDCDGIDDAQAEVDRVVFDPATNQYVTKKVFVDVDIRNTDYWKKDCAAKANGILGSSPLMPNKNNGTPVAGSGATLDCNAVGFRFDSFEAIICTIRNLIYRVFMPFAFVFATLMFMYGVIKYYMAADSTAARQEGRRFIIWAVLALFIMISIWGLIQLVSGTLGFGWVLPQLLTK